MTIAVKTLDGKEVADTVNATSTSRQLCPTCGCHISETESTMWIAGHLYHMFCVEARSGAWTYDDW